MGTISNFILLSAIQFRLIYTSVSLSISLHMHFHHQFCLLGGPEAKVGREVTETRVAEGKKCQLQLPIIISIIKQSLNWKSNYCGG